VSSVSCDVRSGRLPPRAAQRPREVDQTLKSEEWERQGSTWVCFCALVKRL